MHALWKSVLTIGRTDELPLFADVATWGVTRKARAEQAGLANAGIFLPYKLIQRAECQG